MLHYTGYTHSRGGIVAVIRGLHRGGGAGRVVHGVSAGFTEEGKAELELWRGPEIDGDAINLRNLWNALAVARAVRGWLEAGPGRIFHGHSRAGLLVGLWLHWLGERRVVVSVHCYGRQRWFYRWAARRLGDRLVWLTPAMKRYYYGTSDRAWTGCVPNSLPGTPVPEMRRWAGGRPLRIGGAGMLAPGKNWELIIRALALLPAGDAVEYFHAGGPLPAPSSRAYARGLKDLARQLGVAERIHWLDWLPSTADLWPQIDLLVVPFAREAFSLSALEALWAGVPVLAVCGGGPDDLIIPGVNGWLISPGDEVTLSQQLRRCLEPGTWREVRAAVEHLACFSAPVVAAQWRDLYTTL
ncbi:MAG: glycosyltransferase family 4 protein [Opitutales bacterium]